VRVCVCACVWHGPIEHLVRTDVDCAWQNSTLDSTSPRHGCEELEEDCFPGGYLDRVDFDRSMDPQQGATCGLCSLSEA